MREALRIPSHTSGHTDNVHRPFGWDAAFMCSVGTLSSPRTLRYSKPDLGSLLA